MNSGIIACGKSTELLSVMTGTSLGIAVASIMTGSLAVFRGVGLVPLIRMHLGVIGFWGFGVVNGHAEVAHAMIWYLWVL